MDNIRIAIAGHTNAGKTTLLRTLTRENHGIVSDRANVTETAEYISNDNFNTEFIDCPGFTAPSIFLKYINIKEKSQGMDEEVIEEILSVFNQEDIKYDRAALDGLKMCDVALYIVDLEHVPEGYHNDEIEIIQLVQNKIIGILNKSRTRNDVAQEEKLTKRIEHWENFFRKNNINHYLQLDAFWDQPSKVKKTYSYIEELLSDQPDKATFFRNGFKNFNSAQDEIKKTASEKLTECIINCREIKINGNAWEDNNNDIIIQSLNNKVLEYIGKFYNQIIEIYKIKIDNSNNLFSKEDIKVNKSTKGQDVIVFGGGGAAMGASMGATLGAVIGAIITSIATGGLGAAAGATLGAEIGTAFVGGVGALAGSLGVVDKNLNAKLTKENLEFIAAICLATLWTISFKGYGNKAEDVETPKIKQHEIKKLFKKTNEYIETTRNDTDLATSNTLGLSEWIDNYFKSLENMKI